MHFGENQLSPGSIGISPLPTGHPPVLQHWWVRASTRSYPRFTLPMGSSPGFGSYPGNTTRLLRPLQTRFRSGSGALPHLNLPPRPSRKGRDAANIHSPDHSTKGTPLGGSRGRNPHERFPPTACQCRGSEALSSPFRGTFHLSLTVLVHYRWPGVSAPWRVVPPASHRVSRAPWYSGTVIPQPHGPPVRYGTLTRSGGPSQTLRVDPISLRCPSCDVLMLPSQPQPHPLAEVTLVWAPARFARHYYGPLPAPAITDSARCADSRPRF